MPGVPPLPSGPAGSSDGPDESAVPPHAERPTAAPPSPSPHFRLRRAMRLAGVVVAGRALRLTAAVVAVGGLAAGCGFGPDAAIAPAPPNPSEAVIREVFGPLGVADQAVSVAQCESGLNAGAGGYYKGLFQLGPHLAGTIDFYGGNWYDPLTNAQVARDLYLQNGGWASWPSCGR